MTPSAEPGKRLVELTGMNGCSAHQNDSKPSSSAFLAMKPTSTWYAGSGTEMPIFMSVGLLPGSAQCLAKRRRDVGGGAVAGGDEPSHRHEAVDHPAIVDVVNLDTRVRESRRVGRALVAQRVEARGDDERRRKTRERRRAQRRNAPVLRLARRLQVVIREPAHAVAREHVAFGEIAIRLRFSGDVRHGVDEHLKRDDRPAGIACHERYDRGEVTAGAVSGDGDTPAIEAELA